MTLSVLFLHRLLLSTIRTPNVTDHEKDGTEHLSQEKKKKSFFCPLHEARFCSRIELSAVSEAPRSASKIMGHTGGKVGQGKEYKGFCSVCHSQTGVPSTSCLGRNGSTSSFDNKSVISIHFYSSLQVADTYPACHAARDSARFIIRLLASPECLQHVPSLLSVSFIN